jgi:hypothetical protein
MLGVSLWDLAGPCSRENSLLIRNSEEKLIKGAWVPYLDSCLGFVSLQEIVYLDIKD